MLDVILLINSLISPQQLVHLQQVQEQPHLHKLIFKLSNAIHVDKEQLLVINLKNVEIVMMSVQDAIHVTNHKRLLL